jgi:hypothetical protein
MNEDDIYLSDKQYLDTLYKIKRTISRKGFKIICEDSTQIGNKYTTSNCGMCSDDFTTKETALFPDEFPERKSMKYRKEYHHCPFDWREPLAWKSDYIRYGCFYTCAIFQKGKNKPMNQHKQRVQTLIEHAENNIK